MLEEYHERILNALDARESAEPFTLKELLANEWPADKGQAIRLGTEFKQSLQAEFPQLEWLGQNRKNHETYRKR